MRSITYTATCDRCTSDATWTETLTGSIQDIVRYDVHCPACIAAAA